MKRKLLQFLIDHADEGGAAVDVSMARYASRAEYQTARRVLQAAMQQIQRFGRPSPEALFEVLVSEPDRLLQQLTGTEAEGLSLDEVRACSALLTEALTERRGRRSTSTFSRAEQLAMAQQIHRERKRTQGKMILKEWVSPECLNGLKTLKEQLGCPNQAETLERLVAQAVHGKG